MIPVLTYNTEDCVAIDATYSDLVDAEFISISTTTNADRVATISSNADSAEIPVSTTTNADRVATNSSNTDQIDSALMPISTTTNADRVATNSFSVDHVDTAFIPSMVASPPTASGIQQQHHLMYAEAIDPTEATCMVTDPDSFNRGCHEPDAGFNGATKLPAAQSSWSRVPVAGCLVGAQATNSIAHGDAMRGIHDDGAGFSGGPLVEGSSGRRRTLDCRWMQDAHVACYRERTAGDDSQGSVLRHVNVQSLRMVPSLMTVIA